jgi:hypothetical protein
MHEAIGMKSLLAILAVVAAMPSAHADDAAPFVEIPPACSEAWTVASGPRTPAAFEAMLSLAACLQDTSLTRISRAEDVSQAVDRLDVALEPAFQFYLVVFDTAPDPLKLRAAYAIGLAETSLMTRARRSLAVPALRDSLEARLEPHAKLAYLIFDGIARAHETDPSFASDAVNRYIVHSAAELARALRERWRHRERRLQYTAQSRGTISSDLELHW